jgi:UDP-N-acetylmuramate dehydrogenase
MWSLQQGYYGLENLALIPGSVGAAPVQNIGAYGVELSDLLQSVTAMDLGSGKLIQLSLEDCEFGYRDSVFKRQRQRFVILEVTLRLARSPQPNIEYPDLRQELAVMRIGEPTPQDIAQAVIRVRQQKLPDPAVYPNVGSFFKNPVISAAQQASLKKQLPALKSFAFADGYKLAAAQLLDLAGWKQKSGHGVSVWPGQPLVLVNEHATDGESVLQFARAIQKDVEERYGVRLEIEPDTIGFN